MSKLNIVHLRLSTVLIMALVAAKLLQPGTSFAEEGGHHHGESKAVKMAEKRGEELLQQCVRTARERVTEADQSVIREEWKNLGQVLGQPAFMDRLKFSEERVSRLSPSGRDRALFLLQWMSLQSQMREMFPKEQVMGNRQRGLNALAIGTLLEQSLQYPKAIGEETTRLMSRIRQQKADAVQARALATLAVFEDSLVRESQRISAQNNQLDNEFRAQARPVLVAVGGTAAFVSAVVYAEPILAASEAIVHAVGLPSAVGSVLGMSGVAGIGATGIDVINDIALPLWVKARRDAIERDIPFSCAIEKQVEIGKVMEIEKLVEATTHGAMVGAAVGTLTVMTPAILSFLGGKLVAFGTQQVWVPMVSAGLWTLWGASMVDEVALFTVTGLVAVGATWEFYRGNLNARASVTFERLISKTVERADKARKAGKMALANRFDEVVKQVRSIQASYGGDVIEQGVNFGVCGYLLMHMAHGEFAIALEGELEEVIEVLALSSDDAPTGIKAAKSAVKQLWATAQSAPISMKVYMVLAKLNFLDQLETPDLKKRAAIETSIAGLDDYINMPHVELMDKINEAEVYLKKHETKSLSGSNPDSEVLKGFLPDFLRQKFL